MKTKIKSINYINKIIVVLFATLALIGVCLCLSSQNIYNTSTAQASETNDSIEFVYQPATDIFVGETVDVCIGFNDKQEHQDAVLNYHKIGTDETFCANAVGCADEMVFFEINATSSEQIGTYLYDNIAWFDNKSQSSLIQKIEENTTNGYSFSVNEKVNSSSLSLTPASVYSITDNGLQELTNTSATSQTQMLLTQDACKNKYQECIATGNSFVVALDAGHGGSDSGACHGGHLEKDLNWRIACACQAELSGYAGVSVYQCRNGDEYVGLQDRVERARTAGANLFVCLHNNSGGGSGCEVWVQHSGGWHPEFNTIGCEIGSRINAKLSGTFGLNNRGLKERYCTDGSTYPDGSQGDYFTVLYWSRYYSIPGLLVEHAFMDGSSADQSALYNDANLDTMGRLDAQAIAEYYGFTKDAPKPTVKSMEDGKATIEWGPISGAEKYAVAKYENGQFYNYTTDLTSCSYTIDGLINGNEYTILVQSYKNGSWSTFSEKNYLVFRQLPCPKVSSSITGDGSIRLSWPALSGAIYYAVAEYYQGEYFTYSTEITSSGDEVYYDIDNLECGIEHKFCIQAMYKEGYWSSHDEKYMHSIVPQGHRKPYNIQTDVTAVTCTLSWNCVPGALGYAVATRNLDGSWKNYTIDTPNNYFTINDLDSGEDYTILVQALFRGCRYSEFTEQDFVVVTTINARPKVSASSAGDGEIQLTWDEKGYATKYSVNEIQNGNLVNLYTTSTEHSYLVSDLINERDYKFVVLGYVEGKWTKYEEQDIATCIPHGYIKPHNVTVTDKSVESISLFWSKVSGAKRYAIATVNDDGTFTTYTRDCTDTSYTVHGLKDSTDYKFLIQADLDGQWSTFDQSDYVDATTIDFRPSPEVVSKGDGTVSLQWNNIQGATQYAIAEYLGGTNYKTFTLECINNNYTVTNLANNYEHTFVVQAFCNGTWSRLDSSRYVSATPTGHIKPYDISFIAGDTSVEFSWPHVAGADFYAVATKNPDGSFYNCTIDCKEDHFVARGLNRNSSYQFLIQANIYGKWSAFESSDLLFISTKNTTPAVSVISEGDGQASISWEPIENAQYYAVAEYKDGKYNNFTTSLTDSSYTITNLSNNKEHIILVQAYVADSWSYFSKADYKIVKPVGHDKPYEVVANPGYSTILIKWHSVPGSSAYAIAMQNADGSYKTYTYSCTSTEFLIEGLSCCTKYKVLVQANIDGLWSQFTESDLVNVSTINTKPSVSLKSVGNGTVTLQWSAVTGAERYAVAEIKNGSYITFTRDCTDLEYTISNLANEKDHYFLVQSYIQGSWSPFTEGDYIKAVPTGPTKPDILNVSPGFNKLSLTWNIVPGTEKYTIATTKDKINYKTYTYDCYDTSYDITGLRGGDTYYCIVQALIDGAWTTFVDADLKVGVPTIDPTRPRPTVTSTGPGSVSFSWDSISKASRYAVALRNSSGEIRTYTYDLTDTSYSVSGLAAGHYGILVQANINDKWSVYDEGDFVGVDVTASRGDSIMSAPRSTAAQMARYYSAKVGAGTYPEYYRNNPQLGATSIEAFAQICYEEGLAEGVDPAVMFCQMIHETGWLRFGGSVKVEQCNFGGLGATSATVGGAWFPDIRTGIRAQIQHLKAYASTDPLVNACVDPRFNLVTRGCAPLVTDLNGRWAVPGIGYGEAILGHMNEMYKY